MIYKVKKRNGSFATFDKAKIEKAISKAIEAVWWTDFSQAEVITNKIIEIITNKVWKDIPDVELIQDMVEEILIKEWHDTVAKAYIIYRQKRADRRKDTSIMVEVWKTMEEYLHQTDWRVNANSNSGYSVWWLILNTSWKITANYWLSHVYSSEIWNAHRNWDYHIHDLDMLSWYCAWWSLRQLLEEWFNWVPNKVESGPPKNFQSAISQMVNFLWTLQNEWAWAQAFSSFDTYLSPYVHKYSEELEGEIEKYEMNFNSKELKQKYIDERTYKYVLQKFIAS